MPGFDCIRVAHHFQGRNFRFIDTNRKHAEKGDCLKISPASLGPKTWETFYALRSFETYQREIEGMIEKEANLAVTLHGPKWVPTTEEDREMWDWERQEARRTHEEVLSPMFRYSLVVLLYSLYETELIRAVGVLEKVHPLREVKRCDLAGDPVAQCFKYLEVFEKIKNAKGWVVSKEIDQLRLVRNCIVHCNGLVTRSSEKAKLVKFWGGDSSFETHGILCINIDGAKIELANEFLTARFQGVWRFYLELFEALDWPIAKEWLASKA